MNKKYIDFVTDIPGWLTNAEGTFLEQASRKTDHLEGVVVELGSFQGKSTIWLAQARKPVYAIDPHKGYVAKTMKFPETFYKFKENIIKARVADTITPIRKTSIDAAKEWNRPIRVLFIDALHDEKNALRDYKIWSKFVVDGGIIAIHDSFLRWCGSEKVAQKYIVNGNSFHKIGFSGSILYGRKGKRGFNLRDIAMRIFINTAILANHTFIILSLPFQKIPKKIKAIPAILFMSS
jgi:predicted O-methyltransferase YrrM